MSSQPKVAGVILAAGEGTRMGRTKQLLPFRGKSILECVVDSALASSLHQTVVVLGHQADLLIPLLENRAVDTVVNSDYRLGQSSSLKAGLRAVNGDVEAVLFLLGDQPLVSPALIDRILAAYATSLNLIVMPVFDGKRGNPVLFSRETFCRFEALRDDCGARPLFEEYAGNILALTVCDQAIHFDIDTEDDYLRLLREE